MLDDSFCCLGSLIFGVRNRIDIPKVPWMPELIGFCGLVVELHIHTNVYAVYARGCSLSVTCQVAMVYNLRARLRYIAVTIPEP